MAVTPPSVSFLNQVIALLPKLTAKERQQVVAAVGLLGASVAATTVKANDDWLLDAIHHHLSQSGLVTSSPLAATHRTAFKQYQAKVPAVLVFLCQLEADNGLGRRSRPALAMVCARALADWLAARQMLNPTFMLSMVDHVPEALDASYPGYVQARLFGAVLEGL